MQRCHGRLGQLSAGRVPPRLRKAHLDLSALLRSLSGLAYSRLFPAILGVLEIESVRWLRLFSAGCNALGRDEFVISWCRGSRRG